MLSELTMSYVRTELTTRLVACMLSLVSRDESTHFSDAFRLFQKSKWICETVFPFPSRIKFDIYLRFLIKI